jgi:S-DNA-T family DNA segregation ATPase FtsK/SpoIIIE
VDTVAAIAGAGLADNQRAAGYLADTWGCVTVQAEQQGPGLIRLRGLHRDPLLAPAQVDLSAMAPASLTSWWLGWAEDSQPVRVRLAEVSGIVVAELAGFGKTMLVAHFLGPSPSWPLVIVVIDEAHTFFHERKGTSPEVKAHNALVAEVTRLVEELVRKGRNVALQVMLLTQRATGDAIPTRIRDNCQVAISFATRTVDGAVAALGEEIRQHPDASPVLLNDPAYVGVAVTSLPGRRGFHRVRTPQVDHHQVAAIVRATAGLRRDPADLLAPMQGVARLQRADGSGDAA